MTVKELQEMLSNFSGDTEVVYLVTLNDLSRTTVAYSITEVSDVHLVQKSSYAEAYGGYGARKVYDKYELDDDTSEMSEVISIS